MCSPIENEATDLGPVFTVGPGAGSILPLQGVGQGHVGVVRTDSDRPGARNVPVLDNDGLGAYGPGPQGSPMCPREQDRHDEEEHEADDQAADSKCQLSHPHRLQDHASSAASSVGSSQISMPSWRAF